MHTSASTVATNGTHAHIAFGSHVVPSPSDGATLPAVPVNTPVRAVAGTFHESGEHYTHFWMREWRIVFRWAIFVSLVVLVVTMLTPLLFFAVVPASILLVSYVLLVITNEIERRSAQPRDEAITHASEAHEGEVVMENADAAAQAHTVNEAVDMQVAARESKIGVVILGGVALAALILAGSIFPLKWLAVAAFFVFAYMLLVALPFLLGMANDDIEIESRRLKGLPPTKTADPGAVVLP